MDREKIIYLVLLLLEITELVTSQDGEDDIMFRLPKDIIPENYDLYLNIEPESDGFSGTVNVSFHLINETTTVKYIYLHADPKFITITKANVIDADDCTYETIENYIVRFSCGNIKEESNFLYIEYDGKYSGSDGFGMVKTTYTESNKRQYLIESNFEPTFARRAFPCFDEPDFKATFSIQVTNPTAYTAVSNSIPQYYNINLVNTTVAFQSTPKISTYLISIFVSNFKESPTTFISDRYTFKFFTRSGFEDLTSKVAGVHYSQIMDVLSNFTGQSFQDIGDTECYQFAVPDYYSERMGNFGLFVYKERDLLDEGEKTTAKVTQNILQAMTYKISHEWFGGEISTTWWSDIWANEAIPIYFKYLIPNQVDNELEFTNQFVVEVVQESMQYDAMPFVEALSSDEAAVSNEWGIKNKLDNRSLLKGATFLQMINLMVGDDTFKTNIKDHLQSRTGLDTNGQNMLEDLATYDGIQDLYSASKSWAFTAGFPVLNVKINTATDKKETLGFSQKRFVYPKDNTSSFSNDVKWTIPISYTTSDSKYFESVINVYYAPNIELFIDILKGNWVLFNIQGRLHYRVNYEEELWRRIISAFKNKTERMEIHCLSRAQVIDDIFNIARTGEVDYSLAFELADSFVYETEYYPWYSALNAFSYLLGKMQNNDIEERLKLYILNLMENVINITNIDLATQDDETHIDVLKKVMLIDWVCKLDCMECINFVTKQFAHFKENQSSMEDYNLRPVIFCYGIKYSKNITEDWKFLWEIYQSSSSVHEQYDILQALGCAEDKEILENYLLKLAVPMNSAYFKRQDTMVVFESVLSNSAGIEAALTFLGSSLRYIQFIFNGASNDIYYLSDMILTLAEKITIDDHLKEFQDILSDNVFSGFEDLRVKATTLATVNNYWIKQYQDVIERLLPDTATTTVESTVTYTTVESTTETTLSTDLPTSTEPSTTTESKSETIVITHIIAIMCVLVLIV